MKKVEKESKRNLDQEIRVLRKENEDLRRTVARCRKALEKQGVPDVEDPEPGRHMTTSLDVIDLGGKGHPCPKGCGGETRVVSTPSSEIVICVQCKARRKL